MPPRKRKVENPTNTSTKSVKTEDFDSESTSASTTSASDPDCKCNEILQGLYSHVENDKSGEMKKKVLLYNVFDNLGNYLYHSQCVRNVFKGVTADTLAKIRTQAIIRGSARRVLVAKKNVPQEDYINVVIDDDRYKPHEFDAYWSSLSDDRIVQVRIFSEESVALPHTDKQKRSKKEQQKYSLITWLLQNCEPVVTQMREGEQYHLKEQFWYWYAKEAPASFREAHHGRLRDRSVLESYNLTQNVMDHLRPGELTALVRKFCPQIQLHPNVRNYNQCNWLPVSITTPSQVPDPASKVQSRTIVITAAQPEMQKKDATTSNASAALLDPTVVALIQTATAVYATNTSSTSPAKAHIMLTNGQSPASQASHLVAQTVHVQDSNQTPASLIEASTPDAASLYPANNEHENWVGKENSDGALECVTQSILTRSRSKGHAVVQQSSPVSLVQSQSPTAQTTRTPSASSHLSLPEPTHITAAAITSTVKQGAS